MPGSIYGNVFKVSTWGESHGQALGVVVDGCPSNLMLSESDIQVDLDKRKPGNSLYATKRVECDSVEILSGIFDGRTTGTPISLVVYNNDTRSHDYSNIKNIYRPAHADYTYEKKYGNRDYRGGGRSSGRETVGRVAAGAIAKKILSKLNITVCAYTLSIGTITINRNNFDKDEIWKNKFVMPDADAASKAALFLDELMLNKDSCGGTIECVVSGLYTGIGEPVFDKLDAEIAKAVLSIGAVKGIEFGLGFATAESTGSLNNDQLFYEADRLYKKTNNSGGISGGISEGFDVVFRCAVKPTPSIGCEQATINSNGENVPICISGRHDPVIVPRAVVVVEAMAAIAIVNLLFLSMFSKIEYVENFVNAVGFHSTSHKN